MNEIISKLLKWAEGTPVWPYVQPFFLVGSAFIATEVFAYGYLGSEYEYRPSIATFICSHVFQQILIAYACLFVVALGFVATRRDVAVAVGRVRAYFQQRQATTVARAIILVLGLTVAVAGVLALMPGRASHIRIVFLDAPDDLRKDAFAYIIYEFNRIQRSWYFEIEYDALDPGSLKSADVLACERPGGRFLCLAKAFYEDFSESMESDADPPMIAITSEQLLDLSGEPVFFSVRHPSEPVAVISTFDRDAYKPLTVYEFLSYWVLVQAIQIHLVQDGGAPDDSFAPGSVSHGDIFAYTSDASTIKATILAARLSPYQEELLLNRFGPAYVASCARLLSFDWLYADRMATNLARVFGVELQGAGIGRAP